jgi:uncharacterized membrane protein
MILVYLVSVIFIAAGAGIFTNKIAKPAAVLVGVLFFLLLIYPQLVSLFADIHNGNDWAVVGEIGVLCGGAFIIAGTITDGHYRKPGFTDRMIKSGRFFFAFSLFIFGVEHFVFADYIATLIPSWIPFRLFWTYFVGVAFFAASISIIIKVKTRLACLLLGFMFLFWVIFVHSPRVIASPQKEPEWTSLFVAMGFCSIFFTLAGISLRPGTAEPERR